MGQLLILVHLILLTSLMLFHIYIFWLLVFCCVQLQRGNVSVISFNVYCAFLSSSKNAFGLVFFYIYLLQLYLLIFSLELLMTCGNRLSAGQELDVNLIHKIYMNQKPWTSDHQSQFCCYSIEHWAVIEHWAL